MLALLDTHGGALAQHVDQRLIQGAQLALAGLEVRQVRAAGQSLARAMLPLPLAGRLQRPRAVTQLVRDGLIGAGHPQIPATKRRVN